jgi:hypothetical protein
MRLVSERLGRLNEQQRLRAAKPTATARNPLKQEVAQGYGVPGSPATGRPGHRDLLASPTIFLRNRPIENNPWAGERKGLVVVFFGLAAGSRSRKAPELPLFVRIRPPSIVDDRLNFGC